MHVYIYTYSPNTYSENLYCCFTGMDLAKKLLSAQVYMFVQFLNVSENLSHLWDGDRGWFSTVKFLFYMLILHDCIITKAMILHMMLVA